ncbi:MAG: hypothetical protein JJU10_04675 [Idiomarina sp.]|nr:hypothetical protein [Idiomarina sp.]
MSKLDKEKVLSEFSDAYKAAHGKAPKVEESSGWFSVDGGKNMRLAQLAEQTAELKGGAKKSAASKPAAKEKAAAKKPAAAKAPAKKAAAKAPAAKASATKKTTKSKSTSGGLTAKEAWRKRLEDERTQCRLPRGFQSAS